MIQLSVIVAASVLDQCRSSSTWAVSFAFSRTYLLWCLLIVGWVELGSLLRVVRDVSLALAELLGGVFGVGRHIERLTEEH